MSLPARIGRPEQHPRFQHRDLDRWELAFRGHRAVGIEVTDRMNERAFAEIAGSDRGAVLAADFPPSSGIESQTAFHLACRRMALVAPAPQNRQDLGAEKLVTLVREGARKRHQRDQRQQKASHLKNYAEARQTPRRILFGLPQGLSPATSSIPMRPGLRRVVIVAGDNGREQGCCTRSPVGWPLHASEFHGQLRRLHRIDE